MKRTTPIDMFTPDQACSALGVGHDGLLRLINSGRLAAYDLGGNIRFKVSDIQAVAARLVAA